MARLGSDDGDLHNARGEHVVPNQDWNPARKVRHYERLTEHHRKHKMLEPIFMELAASEDRADGHHDRLMDKARGLLHQALGAEKMAEGVTFGNATDGEVDDGGQ